MGLPRPRRKASAEFATVESQETKGAGRPQKTPKAETKKGKMQRQRVRTMIGNSRCASTSRAAKSYGMSAKPMVHGASLCGRKAMAVWGGVVAVAVAVIVRMWTSSAEIGKDDEIG